MKEAENIVEIKGKLSEVNLRAGEKEGKHYISGNIVVKINQEISGKEVSMDLPVYMFASEKTKKGDENPAYKSALAVMNEMQSIAACKNVDKADSVSITKGQLEENPFMSQQGKLILDTRIRASFVNKLTTPYEPLATFTTVIIIGSITPELKDGEETGRLIISGILPQYGEKVDVIPFIVESKAAIKHIEAHWQKGETVRVFGKINYSTKTITTEESVGFGDPIKKTRTETTRELIVTSGSETGFPDESAYVAQEVSAALIERKARLAELENGSTAKKNNKNILGF